MADVQLEHGFTRVADALLEAICAAPIPGRNVRVFVALIRLIYGYGKTRDRVAAGQISKLTGLDRRSVNDVLGELEAAGMIWRGPLTRGRSRTIGIVKDFDRWTTRGAGESPRTPTGETSESVETPGVGVPALPLVGVPALHTRERERKTRESAAATPRKNGSASPRQSSPETPTSGAAAPRTSEPGGEPKTPEAIGAAAPRRSRPSNPKTAVRKTRCPARLDPEDRARVVAWRDSEHPTKFSDLELALQWRRFVRWHTGQLTLDADWAGRFENWLTSDKFAPLAHTVTPTAQPTLYTSNQEPREPLDPDELERVREECRLIREAAGIGRRSLTVTPISRHDIEAARR